MSPYSLLRSCCIRSLRQHFTKRVATRHLHQLNQISRRKIYLSRTFQYRISLQNRSKNRYLFNRNRILLPWTAPSLDFSSAAPSPDKSEPIIITESTIKRMQFLKSKRKDEDLMLRIGVDAGGCSGFSYQFEFTTPSEIEEDDLVVTHEDTQFVIDKISLKFLKGAKLDFVSDFIQRSFVVVDNPNIVSECGCNVSFAPNPELLEDDDDDEEEESVQS